MSFKLFDIEFNSDEDLKDEGSEKFGEVCKIVGTKFIKEWIEYWIEKGKIERVISSFSYTSDLSTDPPKPPGMKDLPKEIRGKVNLGEYIEEKDRPHNIKADNRYKHQYQDKSRKKIL